MEGNAVMTLLARGNAELEGPRQKDETGQEAAEWEQGSLKEREEGREGTVDYGRMADEIEALGRYFMAKYGRRRKRQRLVVR
jgi:hypothetical protein